MLVKRASIPALLAKIYMPQLSVWLSVNMTILMTVVVQAKSVCMLQVTCRTRFPQKLNGRLENSYVKEMLMSVATPTAELPDTDEEQSRLGGLKW